MTKTTRILFLCFISLSVFAKNPNFNLWKFELYSDDLAKLPSLTQVTLNNISEVDLSKINLQDAQVHKIVISNSTIIFNPNINFMDHFPKTIKEISLTNNRIINLSGVKWAPRPDLKSLIVHQTKITMDKNLNIMLNYPEMKNMELNDLTMVKNGISQEIKIDNTSMPNDLLVPNEKSSQDLKIPEAKVLTYDID